MNLLTHSSMSCAKTCPRKFQYRYEIGIRRDRDAQPLRMGSAFHLGVELAAGGTPWPDAMQAAVAGYDTPEATEDWVAERTKVVELLNAYAWRWQATPDMPLGLYGGGGLEIVANEQAFEMPITNPATGGTTQSFRLAGKIDKIVRLPDGRLAVMEHKTTSDDLDASSDYWKRLRIDQQISTYYFAARHLGYDVETVLYDVVRKPLLDSLQVPILDSDGVKIVLDADGNRLRTADGKKWRESGDAAKGWRLQSRRQTPEEYGERLRADIGERPDWYFARMEIPRMQADLDEFAAELWQIQQQLRESQNHGRWFRNTSACISPYRCEYLDVCHGGLSVDGVTPNGFVRVNDLHPELSA